jgi:hypothetical protein
MHIDNVQRYIPLNIVVMTQKEAGDNAALPATLAGQKLSKLR